MSRTVIALFLVLAAGAVRADETLPISDVVQEAMSANARANAVTSSPIDVKGRGDALQRSLERAKIGKAGKYNWAVDPDMRDGVGGGKDASALINASAKYLKPDGISVPGPTTSEVFEYLKKMDEDGRVKSDTLGPNSLGTYTPGENIIRTSRFLVWMCWKIGPRVCAAVLYHEAGHGLDADLHQGHNHGTEDMDRVIREESKAFTSMQRYLRGAYASDREGHEMLATTLMELEAEQRLRADPRLALAIAYIRTVNEVYSAIDATGKPDDKKLEKLIRRLYKADGAPASTSA